MLRKYAAIDLECRRLFSVLQCLVTFVILGQDKNSGILPTPVDVCKMRLRILVADDNRRALLTLVTALSRDFDVIATADNGRSALEQISRLQPSVAVLDLNMPELNGIEVTKEIARQRLSCAVVICSVAKAPELIEAALAAGALGYVCKRRLLQDLSIAVKHAAQGESFVSKS